MSVTITTTPPITVLRAPWSPELPPLARAAGGRWDAAAKAWAFDARDEARVRDIAREVYGSDGSDADAPTLTVRVPIEACSNVAELAVAGRRLASRRDRDEQVRLGPDVVLVSGGFPASGGSRANPSVNALAGTVLEVRDLPAGTARLVCEQMPGASLVPPAGTGAHDVDQPPTDQSEADQPEAAAGRPDVGDLVAVYDEDGAQVGTGHVSSTGPGPSGRERLVVRERGTRSWIVDADQVLMLTRAGTQHPDLHAERASLLARLADVDAQIASAR